MYYIILFIICFVWTSSAFPDFDLPFPIKSAKKHSIETILSESRKQKVGSPEILKTMRIIGLLREHKSDLLKPNPK